MPDPGGEVIERLRRQEGKKARMEGESRNVFQLSPDNKKLFP
jgi:hypothetical protein